MHIPVVINEYFASRKSITLKLRLKNKENFQAFTYRVLVFEESGTLVKNQQHLTGTENKRYYRCQINKYRHRIRFFDLKLFSGCTVQPFTKHTNYY